MRGPPVLVGEEEGRTWRGDDESVVSQTRRGRVVALFCRDVCFAHLSTCSLLFRPIFLSTREKSSLSSRVRRADWIAGLHSTKIGDFRHAIFFSREIAVVRPCRRSSPPNQKPNLLVCVLLTFMFLGLLVSAPSAVIDEVSSWPGAWLF